MVWIIIKYALVEDIWGIAGLIREVFDNKDEAQARESQLADIRLSVEELTEDEILKAKLNHGYIE